MCNVLVSCDFFFVYLYVNKLKEIFESLFDELRVKLSLKVINFVFLYFFSMVVS